MSKIAYLCSDLLFTSKIRETARGLGHQAVLARDAATLADAARGAALVIVDLRRPDAIPALDALAADESTRTVPTIGFCEHERIERFEEARRRGCRAVAQGKFSSDLPSLMGPAREPGDASR